MHWLKGALLFAGGVILVLNAANIVRKFTGINPENVAGF